MYKDRNWVLISYDVFVYALPFVVSALDTLESISHKKSDQEWQTKT